MPFTLARNANNVVTEVWHWQYFLRDRKIPQVGGIDGAFGQKTENGTKIFQVQCGLPPNSKVNAATLEKAQELGYTILYDDYYDERSADRFPAQPVDLSSPSNAFRNRSFTASSSGSSAWCRAPTRKPSSSEAAATSRRATGPRG